MRCAVYIRKAQAGSAPGYIWTSDGQIIEVDDNLGLQLLAIPGGGFTQAFAPPAMNETPENDEPVKRKGRPPLPRDEDGNIIRDPAKTEIAE